MSNIKIQQDLHLLIHKYNKLVGLSYRRMTEIVNPTIDLSPSVEVTPDTEHCTVVDSSTISASLLHRLVQRDFTFSQRGEPVESSVAA